MQLSVKEWRVRFTVAGRHVRVIEICSGFRASQLAEAGADEARRWHREFLARWPREIATRRAQVRQAGSAIHKVSAIGWGFPVAAGALRR